MKKLKKLFGEFDLTWTKLIIFAVIAAVYTALMCIIPGIKETSFHDIAVNPEVWLLVGIFIAVNSRSWYDAALKCFVFFLISQPLIYLIQVPFYKDGFAIFNYYRNWIIPTILTLPAGAAAFFLKKKNWLSAIFLTIANAFFAYMAAYYLKSVIWDFPYHIISMLFCIAVPVLLIFILFDTKKLRTVLLIVFAVILAAMIVGTLSRIQTQQEVYLGEGEWTYTVTSNILHTPGHSDTASITLNGDTVTFKAKRNGTMVTAFENEKGEVIEYMVSVGGGNVIVSQID